MRSKKSVARDVIQDPEGLIRQFVRQAIRALNAGSVDVQAREMSDTYDFRFCDELVVLHTKSPTFIKIDNIPAVDVLPPEMTVQLFAACRLRYERQTWRKEQQRRQQETAEIANARRRPDRKRLECLADTVASSMRRAGLRPVFKRKR
jgi:hypothetical protein